jgi:hypothetical protein
MLRADRALGAGRGVLRLGTAQTRLAALAAGRGPRQAGALRGNLHIDAAVDVARSRAHHCHTVCSRP